MSRVAETQHCVNNFAPGARKGRHPRSYSSRDNARIRELHAKGWSSRQIAMELGRSRGSMLGQMWRLGYSKHLPGPDENLGKARRIRKSLQKGSGAPLEPRGVQLGRKASQWTLERIGKPRPPPVPGSWQSRFVNPQDRRAGR